MAHDHDTSASQLPARAAWVVPAVALVFFVLGVVGHLELHNPPSDAVFKSLQLFHLHYHPFPDTPPGEGSAAPHHGAPPWTIQVARFGAGLWGLALLPVLLGLAFEDRVLRWWVRIVWSEHVVVWGHCTRTLSLIRDLSAQRRKVVFIGQCPGPVSELPAGVCHLPTTAVSPSLLRHAGVSRASHLVALNENDRDNLELLVAADAACVDRKTNRPPLECHAHFADTHLQSGLYRRYATRPAAAQCRTREQLFNYYDLAARLLVRQYPLPEVLAGAVPPPEHIVIVGFGAFGQCVALKLVKMGQRLHRNGDDWTVITPRLTVVDPRGEAVAAPFLRAHPAFPSLCDFTVAPVSCDSASFLDLSLLNAGARTGPVSIVFCLEDEAITLRTLLLLLDACRTSETPVRTIYLRIARPESLTPLFSALDSDNAAPRVVLFAPDAELFSADVLLGDSLDVLAREVHTAYLSVAAADRRRDNVPPAADKQWPELSEEDRDSNREAADHIWAKLASLGYRLQAVPAGHRAPEPAAALLAELRTREDELARVEHVRWMTWKVLQGWRYGSPRSDNQHLHPCLVDFDVLPEETKDKDRAIIRAIPALLRSGRLRVDRRT